MTDTIRDPHLEWMEKHINEIPHNKFLALDLAQDRFVFICDTGEEMGNWLESLPDKYRESLFLTHSAAYHSAGILPFTPGPQE